MTKFANREEYERWKAEKLKQIQKPLTAKEDKTNGKRTFFGKLFGRAILEKPKENVDLIDFLNCCNEIMSQDGTDKDEIPGGYGEFGSLSNPIPVRGIIGTHEYLNNLNTINDREINFVRLGSTCAENIKNPIDIYEVSDTNGDIIKKLHISMYHKKNSCRVPNGFKFKSSIRKDEASTIRDFGEKALHTESMQSKRIKDIFEEIVNLGRKRGVLTYDEINEALPTNDFSPDDFEDLMDILQDMGIKVVDSHEIEENSKERKLARLLAESILLTTTFGTQQMKQLICCEDNPSEIEIIRAKFNLSIYVLATYIRYINIFGNMFGERDHSKNSFREIIDYLYEDFNNSIDYAFKNLRPKIVDIVVDSLELTEISKKIGNDVHSELSTSFSSLLYILLDKRLQQYFTAFSQLSKNNMQNCMIFPPVKVFLKHLTGDEYGKTFSVYISPAAISLSFMEFDLSLASAVQSALSVLNE